MSVFATDDFAPAFDDFGEEISIDINLVTALVDRPQLVSGPWPGVNPYVDEPQAPMAVTVRQTDLAAIGQWPLNDPVITIDERSWRSLGKPHDDGNGLITIKLKESA
jgi:hypothetical protein